jgi:hypothetical protein
MKILNTNEVQTATQRPRGVKFYLLKYNLEKRPQVCELTDFIVCNSDLIETFFSHTFNNNWPLHGNPEKARKFYVVSEDDIIGPIWHCVYQCTQDDIPYMNANQDDPFIYISRDTTKPLGYLLARSLDE